MLSYDLLRALTTNTLLVSCSYEIWTIVFLVYPFTDVSACTLAFPCTQIYTPDTLYVIAVSFPGLIMTHIAFVKSREFQGISTLYVEIVIQF